jgi:hypothetical protein
MRTKIICCLSVARCIMAVQYSACTVTATLKCTDRSPFPGICHAVIRWVWHGLFSCLTLKMDSVWSLETSETSIFTASHPAAILRINPLGPHIVRALNDFWHTVHCPVVCSHCDVSCSLWPCSQWRVVAQGTGLVLPSRCKPVSYW